MRPLVVAPMAETWSKRAGRLLPVPKIQDLVRLRPQSLQPLPWEGKRRAPGIGLSGLGTIRSTKTLELSSNLRGPCKPQSMPRPTTFSYLCQNKLDLGPGVVEDEGWFLPFPSHVCSSETRPVLLNQLWGCKSPREVRIGEEMSPPIEV
jgi:hypothetical protein